MFISFEQHYRTLRIRGARVIAAAIFTLFAVAWFWTVAVLPDRERFTLYFSSNIHGISVGAPVQMDGQTVGEVDEIRIVSVPANDIRHKYYAAVTISLDTALFEKSRRGTSSKAQEHLSELIRRGLCGQLRMPSLLANGLCVSLYFAPGQPVNYINPPNASYPEIPTNYKSTSELVDRINAFIETENLYALAEKIRMIRAKILTVSTATENFNGSETNRKLVDLLEKANRALDAHEFRYRLAEINSELSSLCDCIENKKSVPAEEYENLRRNVKSLSAVLHEIRSHAQTIRESLSDEAFLPEILKLQDIREYCAPITEFGKAVFF